MPDLKYGEEVCAWVRLRDGEHADRRGAARILPRADRHLQDPQYIRFTTEFPTTVTGKIQKFRMREISTEELGLGRAAVDTA